MATKMKREYYPTKKLKSECFVLKGKKYGEYKKYYESGKIYIITNYVNNTLNGEFKLYYESEKIHIICYYVNNILQGDHKYYYENGQLHQNITYVDGKKNGPFEEYYENGQFKMCRKFVNDVLLQYGEDGEEFKSYHENGKLKDHKYYIDKFSYKHIEYFDNGIIYTCCDAIINESTGDITQDYKRYNNNGILEENSISINGTRNGPSKTFHDNGQILDICYYVDGKKK